jgi:hypothetical protein
MVFVSRNSITYRRPLQWPQPKSFIVVDVVFKCLRQRSNVLKRCLPAVFYMYVFSWFHSVLSISLVSVWEVNFVLVNSKLIYVINRLIHAFFHIRTVIIPRMIFLGE